MNGTDYLLDTNIVLYLLAGDKVLADILNNKKPYLSFISEMELLGSPQLSIEEEKKIQSFLSECFIIEMNQQIKQSAIQIRKRTGLKLPDSIIAASAEYSGIFLLTADTDFVKLKSLNILQYKQL